MNPRNSNRAIKAWHGKEILTLLRNFDETLELDSQTLKFLQSQGHHSILTAVRLNHPDKFQPAAMYLA